MVGMRNATSRVGAGRANQNALRVAGTPQHVRVELDEIAAELQRPVFPIFQQPRVTIHDADDFDLVPQKRIRRRRNDGVGGGSWTAGEQNGHPAKRGDGFRRA